MRNPALNTTPNPEMFMTEPRVFPAVDFHDRSVTPVAVAAPIPSAGGIKFDQGKPQMSLIDSRFLVGLAEVLTFGALKYSPNNWRKGMPYSRLYDALQRHLVAFNDGENNDPESGKSHLYHAACCLMFLSKMSETRPDLDDRYTTKQV